MPPPPHTSYLHHIRVSGCPPTFQTVQPRRRQDYTSSTPTTGLGNEPARGSGDRPIPSHTKRTYNFSSTSEPNPKPFRKPPITPSFLNRLFPTNSYRFPNTKAATLIPRNKHRQNIGAPQIPGKQTKVGHHKQDPDTTPKPL
jgi:hypothetical protein